MAPLRNSTAPDERRHQVRHRLTSTVYVELGPGNGGIIVSLGTGGLSVHAAVKLKAEMELTLRFRLEPTEEPIEVAGRVAWLDPTQKEAGIFFKDLSSDTERRIADWIATREQPVSVTQRDISPQPKSPSTSGLEAPLSVQAPVPASLTETTENAQSNVSERIPRRVIQEPSLDNFSSRPSGLQRTTSPPAALTFPTLEERFDRPSDKLLRLPAKRYESVPEPQQPAPAAKEIPPRDSGLPNLAPAPTKVAEVNRAAPRPAPRVDDSAALKIRRRRKLGIAGAAVAAGILALTMTAMIGSRPAGHGGSGGESAQPVSSTAELEAERAPQTARGQASDQSAQGDASADDPTTESDYDLLPILPTNQPATVPRDGEWGANVESMFGLDVPMKVNPAVLGLPVWTVQHSGYYYCVDNLNSETPQTGALMAQGEALQSGYQPKLGNYCH